MRATIPQGQSPPLAVGQTRMRSVGVMSASLRFRWPKAMRPAPTDSGLGRSTSFTRSAFTGGENGLPGVPTPNLNLWFTTIEFDGNLSMYAFFAFWYFVGLVIALRFVRSPVSAGSVALTVFRGALKPLSADVDAAKPEVHERFRERLMDWVLHRAYLK